MTTAAMTPGSVRAFVFLFFALFIHLRIYCQPGSATDSSLLPVREYFAAIGGNSYLYNGPEYVTLDPSVAGSPFFISDSMTAGRIAYNGGEFSDVLMLFDLFSGKVVINRYNQQFRISLVPEKLSFFEIHHHHFVRLNQDSVSGSALLPGFYDLIYQGRSQVWVQRVKKNEHKIEYNVETQTYREHDDYFIRTGGKFYAVNDKAALLKVFGVKKAAVKKFMRRKKLNYKKSPENALIGATSFFDQTTP